MSTKKYKVVSNDTNDVYEFEALSQLAEDVEKKNLPLKRVLRFHLADDHNYESHKFYNKDSNTLEFPTPEFFFEIVE